MALASALLAAGSSSRMRGRDKLLEPVDGVALLRHLACAVLASGAGPLAVTLRADDPARRAVLAGLALEVLPVLDANEGLSASLRAAAIWAAGIGAEGLMLCPADLPELESRDFAALAAAFDPDGPPLRACAEDGTPGHPVIFPARFLEDFAMLAGDRGAQGMLARHPPKLFPLPGRRAVIDLDTPEDWAVWRDGKSPPG